MNAKRGKKWAGVFVRAIAVVERVGAFISLTHVLQTGHWQENWPIVGLI